MSMLKELFSRLMGRDGKLSLPPADSEAPAAASEDLEDEVDGVRQRKLFKFLDRRDSQGKDGRIESKLLLQTMYKMKPKNNRLDPCEILDEMDPEGSGYVEWEAFHTTLTRLARGSDGEKAFSEAVTRAHCAQEIRLWPPPRYTLAIAVANLVAFFIHVLHITRHPDHIARGDNHVYWNSGTFPSCYFLVYSPKRRRELWRFLTYSLVHSTYYHVLINTVILLLSGWALENNHGAEVLLVYLGGVAAGSLAVSALDPHYALAGASAGMCALATANVACLVLNWKFFNNCYRQSFLRPCSKGSRLTRTTGVRLTILRLTFVGLLVVWDLGNLFYKVHYRDNDQCSQNRMICKNSYTSHVSGMLAGLLVGFYVLRIKGGEGSLCRSLDLFRRRLCPVIMAALVAFCVAKNIWGADYPAEDYCPLGLGEHRTCDERWTARYNETIKCNRSITG